MSKEDAGGVPSRIRWPEDRPFAFTIFDDPDGQDLARGREVYAFLADLGFRTTKGVWPLGPTRPHDDDGGHCEDPEYRAWVLELQSLGFEIGYHNASCHSSPRPRTLRALDEFRDTFGHDPRAMSNHYSCREGIYFGDARLSGSSRWMYNALTLGSNRGRYVGHREDDPHFWGDACRDRVRYVRNFVFAEIDTLAACPQMPYRDPDRPYVAGWYASSEGNVCSTFVEQISESRQDRLEASGGVCIMYTHLGHGFCEGGSLHPRFRSLMERLASKNGWYAPVSTVLDHLAAQRGGIHTLTPRERRRLERRWLAQKIRVGSR